VGKCREIFKTYSRLELEEVIGAKCVCFCDNGNEVDAAGQTLHDLDVERLQAVTSGADEVETSVDAQVDALATARLLLLEHV
jgi:hypothetical protein